VKNARTGKDATPRFLGERTSLTQYAQRGSPDPQRGRRSEDAAGRETRAPESENRLDALAQWLTSPTNERFAKAQVNRIWYHLMGRGIVDPIDDFRPTNPASNPALLDALARDFVEHKYDLRHMIQV